eukprot:TRINITY_DN55737_c0_g1_i1.p1 TRINITY_DN55737_c0_g1~~TRINITY_DN55737_c0_g1_i1.p1  ORF type:complete len:424 (+),score=67.08 TRINITY_DN55737_c0_g1_i1:147-1418(+)
MPNLFRKVTRRFDPTAGTAKDPDNLPLIVVALGCEPRRMVAVAEGVQHYSQRFDQRCVHVSGQGPFARSADEAASCEAVLRKVASAARDAGTVVLSGVDDIAMALDGACPRRMPLVAAALLFGPCPGHVRDHFAVSQRLRTMFFVTAREVSDCIAWAWVRHRAAADGQVIGWDEAEDSRLLAWRLRDRPATLRALRTVALTLRNKGADGKYGIIQTGTQRFQEVVASQPSAMGMLRLLGFAEGPRRSGGDGTPLPPKLQHCGTVDRAKVSDIVVHLEEALIASERVAEDDEEDGPAAGPDSPFSPVSDGKALLQVGSPPRPGLALPRQGSLLPAVSFRPAGASASSLSPPQSPKMRWRPSADGNRRPSPQGLQMSPRNSRPSMESARSSVKAAVAQLGARLRDYDERLSDGSGNTEPGGDIAG